MTLRPVIEVVGVLPAGIDRALEAALPAPSAFQEATAKAHGSANTAIAAVAAAAARGLIPASPGP